MAEPTDPNTNPAKDTGFGVLNDVSPPTLRKKFNPANGNTMQAVAVATAESYVADGIKNVGQFKGIVLRVTEPTPDIEPGTSLWNFFSFLDPPAAEPPALVKIKVRVPEVHSMLPIPETLGPEGDHKVINMYPTFVAQSTAVQTPEPGDIVWVDWGNRQNWTEPYYIRPVLETIPGPANGLGGPNGADAHSNCSGNSYSAKKPTGDAVAGSNSLMKPFTGLPRLKRKPKSPEQQKPVFIKDANVDPVSAADWEKVSKALPPGTSIMWGSKWNGYDDKDHKPHGKRMSLVWFSATVDWNQPWELIYWFHGLEGFSKKNFEKRIVPQLKKMVGEGRNFVFVKPELPWSIRGTGKAKGLRQRGAWYSGHEEAITETWGGDFAKFHADVLDRLPSEATKFLGWTGKQSLITVYGHSNGGSAIARAAEEGALKEVKPGRIFFSDSDYGWGYPHGGAIGTTWEKYVKNNKDVWLTAMTIDGHTPRKLATEFFLGKKEAIKDRPIYHIQTNKSHGWCGNNALSVVSEEHRKRVLEKEKDNKKKADEAPPDDDEGQENASATEEQKPKTPPDEPPKKDESGEAPAQQKPAAAPSKSSKSSSTAQPPSWEAAAAALTGGITGTSGPKPDFKAVASVVYKENRVKVGDYGGPLIGEAAANLLEQVEPAVKLHKLAAKRYRAFKAAAIAAGFKDFKISSGWREHRWDSKEHYEKYIKDKYPDGDGRSWLAYNSPHELGLAMDVKAHGVYASKGGSKTKAAQEKTDLYIWMKDHAHTFGLTPYKKEPWHWELRLPYDAYASGQEFTQDMAVRVTDIGTKKAQFPSGPSTGGAAPRNSAPCVRTGGGGGAVNPGAPYAGGGAKFSVGGGGKPKTHSNPTGKWYGGAKGKKKGSAPGGDGSQIVWGWNPQKQAFNKMIPRLQAICLHETSGHPHGAKSQIGILKSKDPSTLGYTGGVQLYGPVDGSLIQQTPVTRRLNHGTAISPYSVGHEMCGFGNWLGIFRGGAVKGIEATLARGIHWITAKGKGYGDLAAEPGKTVPFGSKTQMLNHPDQFEGMWKTVKWIHGMSGKKDPDGDEGNTVEIDVPIEFPCIRPDEKKFWWTKWNGGPTNDQKSSGVWWTIFNPNKCPKDQVKTKRPKGITCHARNGKHHDGLPQVYYCYARASGMGPKDAFWALVGALGSAEKTDGMFWTPLPTAKMVKIGKSKYPVAWFTAKTLYHFGGPRAKTKAKWEPIAKSNPSWFASTTKLA